MLFDQVQILMNVAKVLMFVLSLASTESEATTALVVLDIAQPDTTAMNVTVKIICIISLF